MFSVLSNRGLKPTSTQQPRRARRSFSLGHESLEDRKVLSTASAFSGPYLVTVETRNFGNDVDVYATLYKNNAVVKSNIPVATTGRRELAPSVSINSNGRFVVAYEDVFSSTDSDVKVRMYNAAGSPLTSAIAALSTSKREYEPSVDLNAFGRVIVAFTQQYSSTDRDVLATQFYPTSTAGTSYSLTQITISNSSTAKEFSPSIYVAPNGDAAVAYTTQVGTADSDIKVAIRRSTGSVTKYNVANTFSFEDSPKVESFGGAHSVTVTYRLGSSRLRRTVSV